VKKSWDLKRSEMALIHNPDTNPRMRGMPGDPLYRPGMDRRRSLLAALVDALAASHARRPVPWAVRL
jgi:hypothetical protein